MKISLDSGITVKNHDYKLILDPSRKVKDSENTFVGISHAHSDHTRRHNAQVISTAQTADLFPYNDSITLPYGKNFKIDGMTVRQHNANHILGSSQFEINSDEKNIVYTGDFRLNKSSLFEECGIPECDSLIIESTYGMPHFKFPTLDEIKSEMESWIKENSKQGKNIVFGSYSLGKSQESINILNDFGIVPVVHPKIAFYSEIYNKHGHKLKFVEAGTEQGNKMLSDRFVSVMPQNLIDFDYLSAMNSVTSRKTTAALLTGWGMLYNFKSRGIDKVFPMSDHADFYQILDYVEKSGAKEVFTVHGYDKELAVHLERRLKVKARPLKQKGIAKWL